MQKPLTTIIIGSIMILPGCSGSRPGNLGIRDGQLAACPSTPNCVSTCAADKRHAIKPYTYTGPLDEAKAKLVSVIGHLPRTKIIFNDGPYVYAEFTSKVWRFVDDVEFIFDDATKTVQFRSASRLGRSDLGANRNRMETIRREFMQE
jgi:uncharacterized protein (DUF1499 family)